MQRRFKTICDLKEYRITTKRISTLNRTGWIKNTGRTMKQFVRGAQSFPLQRPQYDAERER